MNEAILIIGDDQRDINNVANKLMPYECQIIKEVIDRRDYIGGKSRYEGILKDEIASVDIIVIVSTDKDKRLILLEVAQKIREWQMMGNFEEYSKGGNQKTIIYYGDATDDCLNILGALNVLFITRMAEFSDAFYECLKFQKIRDRGYVVTIFMIGEIIKEGGIK